MEKNRTVASDERGLNCFKRQHIFQVIFVERERERSVLRIKTDIYSTPLVGIIDYPFQKLDFFFF